MHFGRPLIHEHTSVCILTPGAARRRSCSFLDITNDDAVAKILAWRRARLAAMSSLFAIISSAKQSPIVARWQPIERRREAVATRCPSRRPRRTPSLHRKSARRFEKIVLYCNTRRATPKQMRFHAKAPIAKTETRQHRQSKIANYKQPPMPPYGIDMACVSDSS